jgi:stress response protein YsnF
MSVRLPDDDRRVIPVFAERVRVGRRRVPTGTVRITKRTRTRVVIVDEPLVREDVVVRRVRVGRFVDGLVPPRWVNGTLVVSVLEEVPVVVQRLRVVEELHIEKRRSRVSRPQRVVVRREEPVVERERGRRPALPESVDEARRPGRR